MSAPQSVTKQHTSSAEILSGLGALFLSLAVLTPSIAFLSPNYGKSLTTQLPFLVIGVILLILGWRGSRKLPERKNQIVLTTTLLLGLLILTFLDLYARPFSFYSLQGLRGVFITAFLFLIFVPENYYLPFVKLLAWTMPILGIYWFLQFAEGRTLFSDDHASFLYRMQMAKENFPNLPFYNPLWNAGYDERFLFATGALNIFALLSPLIYLTDVWKIYNYIPLFILFILTPACTWLATRVLGLNNTAKALAVIFSLTSSLAWYHWGFHFGPLGFLTTTALSPLLLALATNFLNDERNITIYEAILIVILATLVLLWSVGGLIFMPVILLAVFRFKKLFRKKFAVGMVLALLLINLPWVLVFWSASNVSSFLKTESKSGARKVSFVEQEKNKITTKATPTLASKAERGLELFRKVADTANPLQLLLLLPGLLLLPRGTRQTYTWMFCWLALIACLGPIFKPQLELDRLLVVAFLLASVPAGLALAEFLEVSHARLRWLKAATLALLCLGLVSLGTIVKGRREFPISFAQNVSPLATAIDQHTAQGRALFTGFVLHELDNGHLAPLVTLGHTPLVASSPFHKYWRYHEIIPSEFLEQKDSGIVQFFDLMNAETLLAHEKGWREYLQSRPDEYLKVQQVGRFQIFKRLKYKPTYFQEGSGQVLEQNSNSLTLRLDSPTAVVKFTYFPFLTSDHCRLSPVAIGAELELIRIEDCSPGTVLKIYSKAPYERIKF